MTPTDSPTEILAPVRTASGRPPLDPVHQAVVDERKNRVNTVGRKTPTRDALLVKNYERLAELQPIVFHRIKKALEDEKDPLHELVVDKLLMRVAPIAFTDALSKQEFAEDDGKKSAPSVTVIVNTNAGMAPAIDVVARDVTDV